MSRYLPSKMRKVKIPRKLGGGTQNQTWRVRKELQGKRPDWYFRLKVKETLGKELTMVTKLLTAPGVMAPLLYLEKLPREDEHDLQDIAYTKECE
ncbi:hypothetical protein SKAU_G00288100 [Synaphobranchus kaupii]|uniref:Uncharacterized protein n=1 Tax=Synaphobranchus kaupii TaxID=118154 RepID=A0A9Q1ET65_SYNKA|nr:hypothetical protein SKAU_G00288100 [Synaphobranchus kaupii]